jgi:hypothetical protein
MSSVRIPWRNADRRISITRVSYYETVERVDRGEDRTDFRAGL